MKVKKIEVVNYKAIEKAEIDLNGCSAIITGGNNRGKTSMLRGIIDRMRGEKPDLIVRKGAEKGSNSIELTDGSRIEWKFTDKSEQITYITKEGFKVTSGVLSQLGNKYFGSKFDIDKFLIASAKEQVNILSRLIGVDLTQLNERYQLAYQERTIANRELKNLEALKLVEPAEVKKPDIEALKQRKADLKTELEKKNKEIEAENIALRNEYNSQVRIVTEENKNFNVQQQMKQSAIDEAVEQMAQIEMVIPNSIFKDCFDKKKAEKIMEAMDEPLQPLPVPAELPEPIYKALITDPTIDGLDIEIENAQKQETQYQIYRKDLVYFQEWQNSLVIKRNQAQKKDKAVKDIEAEKATLINKANLPKEFKFTEDGIYYNGFPLTNNQLSSSAKYIAALKLNAMVLGEVKTMHFDASFLDKNSLAEIEAWANENDLQLLIERPDYDGGEIAYEIINNG